LDHEIERIDEIVGSTRILRVIEDLADANKDGGARIERHEGR
jgi:hypothetical protein